MLLYTSQYHIQDNGTIIRVDLAITFIGSEDPELDRANIPAADRDATTTDKTVNDFPRPMSSARMPPQTSPALSDLLEEVIT